MFVKKSRAKEPWDAGVPSCSRWEDQVSHIPVVSAMGIGGVMRERAMSRSGVSKRRCRRREMSPRYMCAAFRRLGAIMKAVRATCRSSATVESRGSVDGSWMDVFPLVCMDNGSSAS